MKLLIAHNRYRYPGGEDVVFSREEALLRSAGHDVVEYVRQNTEIQSDGILNDVKTGIRTLWASETARELRSILRKEKPQLVHFHNTFPLISPAAYYACKEAGVAVVQSLHNPRIICPAATHFREGRVCEDCLGRGIAWPGVLHACYHSSRPRTAVVAGLNAVHRLLGTWREQVDAYIVFSEFFRQRFIAAGLPPEKIFLKPHFLTTDPGMKQELGEYALFLGRLAPEKGIRTLLKAWQSLKHIPLVIAGAGPLQEEVRKFQQGNSLVRAVSHLPQQECFGLIKGARFLIWPSEGYVETFGLVAIEAFACGLPVIASRVGAMADLVEDQKSGLHFEAGNPDDLAAKVAWAWNHPLEMETIGLAARAEYMNKYTAARNYDALMQIYDAAIQRAASQNAHWLPVSTSILRNRV
jgi:glycosyltransferase involved in cell wall biosynthesis